MFFPLVASVHDLTQLSREPANTLFFAYFKALEGAVGLSEPFKGAARTQAEVVKFVSRRARAMMEVPAQLAKCRNPQDLLNEQMRFWDAAAEEYSEASQRVAEAWKATLKPPVTSNIPTLVADVPRVRDYIEFPVPKRARRTEDRPETYAYGFA